MLGSKEGRKVGRQKGRKVKTCISDKGKIGMARRMTEINEARPIYGWAAIAQSA